MTSALSLSTDGLPARETVSAWRDWMDRLFGGLESDVYGDTQFEGHLHTTVAGDVRLVRLEANRHRVRQMRSGARDTAWLKIVAPWKGLAHVQQLGRHSSTPPGTWSIYDTSEPYTVSNAEPTQHLIVLLPKAQLAASDLRLSELMGRRVGGGAGIARVALEAMRNTYLELPSMSAQSARGAGDMIVELVRLSLRELAGQGSAAPASAALRERIRDYVGRHLRDASLSIDGIAEALHCSKRLLHKSFGDEEETLAQHILRRRLEGCMRELRDPALATHSITDIAFSWGFNSSAQFSRVFRAHTGLRPSDYRTQSAEPVHRLSADA